MATRKVYRTRSQLAKLKGRFKKAGVLADMSKISRAAFSRALAGKSRLGLKTLYKLVDQLDTESAAELMAAYLMDMIPPKLDGEVYVCLRRDPRNAPSWDPLVQKILALPPEPRIAFEQLADVLLQSGREPPEGPITLLDKHSRKGKRR
jgi:hypothetical protein